MEKIKQALERAREQRTSTGDTYSDPEVEKKEVKPETSPKIHYTTTKSIDISVESLRQKRVIVGNENDNLSDQYKVLRTHVLQRLKSNNWNSLAITSPNEGCGKSLTSINLAISLAREVNHTVLLVDLDLRRPSIHGYFFNDEWPGISDYLNNDVELSEMLFNPGLDRLVVLPGNKSIVNSSKMLSSPKMVQLVNELKSRYPNRIVIFDMPPLLAFDDMLAFSPYVDAIMMVVEEGRTRKDELIKAYELLKTSNLLGTVLNKSKENQITQGYYY